jgi:DNA-binding NarL/FixJ family response regulator
LDSLSTTESLADHHLSPSRLRLLSDCTVKTHIDYLFAKIGAHDRAQAVTYACQHGLI